MDQQAKSFNRIITGHDTNGKGIFVSAVPTVEGTLVGGPGGPTFFEIWHTQGSPATITAMPVAQQEDLLVLPPPASGTRMRIIDFPPEGEEIRKLTAAEARAKFQAMGDENATTGHIGSPHPLMHRTETIDYGIVLEGEITLVLDESERLLMAGDVVIQRGTNHAWANRSAAICRMAFVLIAGKYDL